FFSSRRRHTRFSRDWSSDVCSSDLTGCICSAGRPHATAEKNIMYTYIVLLKGINVGGHKKVPMAALRDILSRVGFENVKTYIQRSEERRVGKECESGWGRENRRSRT